jgi:hypothetical protein
MGVGGSTNGGASGAGSSGGAGGGPSAGAITCSSLSVKLSGAVTADHSLAQAGACADGNVAQQGMTLTFAVPLMGGGSANCSFLAGVAAGTTGTVMPSDVSIQVGGELYTSGSAPGQCQLNLAMYDNSNPSMAKIAGAVTCSQALPPLSQSDGGALGAKIEKWEFSLNAPISN